MTTSFDAKARRQRIDDLWETEKPPPYAKQTEDDASLVWGRFFYTWIGDFLFRAARDELTLADFPRPTQVYRSFDAGLVLTRELQRQFECEHGWDNLVGQQVVFLGDQRSLWTKMTTSVVRLFAKPGKGDLRVSPVRVGAVGTLRWVGRVQQYNTGRQRYAGVEWQREAVQNPAEPSQKANAVQDGFHNGTLNGETLFETQSDILSATCEPVESVSFLPTTAGAAAGAVQPPPPPLPRGMNVAFGIIHALFTHLLKAGPLRLIRDLCTVSLPLLLKGYVDYLTSHATAAGASDGDSSTSWGVGLLLVLGFFVVSFLQNSMLQKYYHCIYRAAYAFKNAISAVIFEKCLIVANKALCLPHINPGRIVNLLSNDVQRVYLFALWVWVALGCVIQLAASIGILYYLLGWPAFVGLAASLVPLPLESLITHQIFSYMGRWAEVTDARIKATNEFLSGIRVIKFMSWEPSFIVRVEQARKKEIDVIRRMQVWNILFDFMNSAVPNLIIAVSFLTYVLAGKKLTAAIVFPVISMKGILEQPFSCIPIIVSCFTSFFVSMNRVGQFVECPESIEIPDCDNDEDDESGGAVDKWATQKRVHQLEASLHRQFVEHVFARSPARFFSASVAAFSPEKFNPDNPAENVHSTQDQNEAGGAAEGDGEGGPQYYNLKRVDLLKNVDLRIPRGKLTMIIGPTGCGKSTLLDTLIGALEVTQGEVRATRSIAYVPQQPWIMNATLRDNVLFFSDVDAARFDAAVSSSQLRADLALLADGLETEIGERGINLSGGQKARVSLARAVYADKELYLLDDPLSALDAHVGERVMHECILGALSGKTRVLATHQVHFAREADYVVELGEGGRVVFWGDAAAYAAQLDAKEELPSSSPASPTVPPPPADQIDAGSPLLGDGTTAIAQKDDGATKPAPGLLESSHSADAALGDGVADEADQPTKDTTVPTGTTDGKLISEEERAEGVVALSVYKRYAMACGGLFIWGCVFALYAVSELAVVSPALWLALWTTHSSVAATVSDATGLTIYLCLTILCVSALPLRFFFTYAVLRRGGLNMHSTLLRVVAAGTMQFFDSTPLGRIVNRFSKDVSQLDDTIQQAVVALFSDSCTVISSVCIMVATQPLILVVLVPCLYVYYRLAGFYNAANRNLRRQTNLTGSPVMTLISTVATGRWTIMAYHKGSHIMREALRCLDQVFCTQYMGMVGNCWFSVRIGLLSNTLVTAIALLGVWQVNRPLGAGPNAAEDRVNLVGVLALSMTMTMSISLLLTSVVKYAAELEADMNSVERVLYYIDNVSQEPGLMDGIEDAIQAHAASIEAVQNKAETAKTTENAKDVCVVPITPSPTTASPATGSPNALLTVTAGSLAFEHVDMRYRAGLPLVLRDVSFTIAPGQKVGVVGRTGSGKSTLLLAFLRLVDICGGRMVVNGRDAKDYDLRELRLLFSMIPQDPLLFDGTVRSNVDPFGESSDGAVWGALRHVGMAERVRSEAGGLDGRVQEGGSNFSVGQRQLLCLARALLKRGSAFLLMDEATANVDPALDRQIQRTVQDVFAAYTVVTIAHRLHTVARYDVIIVMDGGRVLESGSPRELVTRADSHFAGLVRSMGAEAQSKFMDALP